MPFESKSSKLKSVRNGLTAVPVFGIHRLSSDTFMRATGIIRVRKAQEAVQSAVHPTLNLHVAPGNHKENLRGNDRGQAGLGLSSIGF